MASEGVAFVVLSRVGASLPVQAAHDLSRLPPNPTSTPRAGAARTNRRRAADATRPIPASPLSSRL
jgi:hypothetical protein